MLHCLRLSFNRLRIRIPISRISSRRNGPGDRPSVVIHGGNELVEGGLGFFQQLRGIQSVRSMLPAVPAFGAVVDSAHVLPPFIAPERLCRHPPQQQMHPGGNGDRDVSRT